MLPKDPPDVESIFDEVVTVGDREAQQQLLTSLCGENASLRQRVESLLKAYEAGTYLESSPAEMDTTRSHDLTAQFIGHYEILELIGEGGMGEVYLARDCDASRDLVAIKVVKTGMDSRQILSRFELEKESLQRMEHPHISRYIDSGISAHGRAFFSMELVRGLPITEYCDRKRLGIDDRVVLFFDVCSAVDHAHQRGIVHRDLKPNNILVAQVDGRPQVKVIDFGVAKALTTNREIDTRFTNAHAFLGTPAYISPEQAEWSSDVDARSDVYSLGAILYELLTGTVPIDVESLDRLHVDELRRAVLDFEPPRPSIRIKNLLPDLVTRVGEQRGLPTDRIAIRLRRDLDWIVLKALEKDHRLRYESAGQLGEDLKAALVGRQTVARSPSLPTRLGKWVGRNASLMRRFSVTSAIIGTIFLVWWANHRIEQSRIRHDMVLQSHNKAQAELEYKDFVADLRQAADALQHGNNRSARTILSAYDGEGLRKEYDHFAIRYLQALMVKPERWPLGHEHDLLDMDVSPDERWIVSCDRGGDIVINDLATKQNVGRLHPADKEVTRVRFSPDGKLLASVGQDQKLRIWNCDTWEPVCVLSRHNITINGLCWSPTGDRLATGDRTGNVHIWDVRTREVVYSLPKHSGHVRCVAWSPDGKYLATADYSRGVILWTTKNWKQSAFINTNDKGVLDLDFSIDGRYLACAGYSHDVIVYDTSAQQELQRVSLNFHDARSLAIGATGELLVGMVGGRIKLFEKQNDHENLQEARRVQFAEEEYHPRRIKFSKDNETIYVASEQGRDCIRLTTNDFRGFEMLETEGPLIGWLPPLHVAIASEVHAGKAAVYGNEGNLPLHFLPMQGENSCRPIYSAYSNLVAIGGEDSDGYCVGLFDAEKWNRIERIPCVGRVKQLGFSRDGCQLLINGLGAANSPEIQEVYDRVTGRRHDLSQYSSNDEIRAAFAPHDDTFLLGVLRKRHLHCIDSRTFEVKRTIDLQSEMQCLRFHPEGKFVLVGESNRISCFAPDLSELLWSSPTAHWIFAIELIGDNRLAACLCSDGLIRLWDLTAREMLYELPYLCPSFSTDPTRYWLSFLDPSTLVLGGLQEPAYIRFSGKRPMPSAKN